MQTLRRRSWSWLLKHFVLPLGDHFFGQKVIRRLRFLEHAQWWDREQVNRHREGDLRDLIAVVYDEVPFYRALMDERRIQPSDIRSLSDLTKLPVVTKDELRQGYPHLTTRKTGQKTFEAHTSGSSGRNFQVLLDTQTVGRYRACFLLALGWAGWHIGEPHMQTGMTFERNLERRFKDWLLRCHYVSAAQLDNATLDANLDVIERYKVQHLWGYPGSLYYLSQRAIEKGWNRPLRSVVTWGDTLFPHYSRTMEQAFQTQVHDTYGCAEGIQVAAQCGHEGHYHIHNLDVIVEYLDEAGEPVTPGQTGSLILTRLHPSPMPLIRYKVGDIGVPGDRAQCSCGRGFEILQSIHGRDTDVVMTPGGNRLIVHFFTGVLEHFSEVDAFQVVQQGYDSLVVRIVPMRGYSEETSQAIISALKQQGANDLTIEVDCVKEIPLTPGGKRRFVINELAKHGGVVPSSGVSTGKLSANSSFDHGV